jgi:hypothetical protein
MVDQLESELRAALRERASEVPSHSVARVTGGDYRPGTRGSRRPMALAAIVGAGGAAGIVAAVALLGAGISNAFAGWTAEPTPISPAQHRTATAHCRAQSPIGGLPLVLSDGRGPFVFEIFANRLQSVACISGPSFTSASGSVLSVALSVAAGKVSLTTTHQTVRNGQHYSLADGHAGSGVTGVKLELDDRTAVVATVENGWFAAWWPGAHDIRVADVYTNSGVQPQMLQPVTVKHDGKPPGSQ